MADEPTTPAEAQGAGVHPQRGRGSLRGDIVMAEDWDSEEISAALARDFGILPPGGRDDDDSEGLAMTQEILRDSDAMARISQSLAALRQGDPGIDLAAMRAENAMRDSRAGRAAKRRSRGG